MRCRRAFVESIEINMIKQPTAPVRIDQRKRRTRHVFLIDAEGARNSLHQYRLACAQWTIEQNDFSATELMSYLDAQIERLAFRPRDPFAGGNPGQRSRHKRLWFRESK